VALAADTPQEPILCKGKQEPKYAYLLAKQPTLMISYITTLLHIQRGYDIT